MQDADLIAHLRNLEAIIAAVDTKGDELAKLMDDLHREMSALSGHARRERMPEFDARVIALMKKQDELGKAARVFLQQSANAKGNA
jgi:CspA family cold shock protein